MTNQLHLFTEPGIGERCIHCQQILTLPNIPTEVLRDGRRWGYAHPNCFAPYILKTTILFANRRFTKGN